MMIDPHSREYAQMFCKRRLQAMSAPGEPSSRGWSRAVEVLAGDEGHYLGLELIDVNPWGRLTAYEPSRVIPPTSPP